MINLLNGNPPKSHVRNIPVNIIGKSRVMLDKIFSENKFVVVSRTPTTQNIEIQFRIQSDPKQGHNSYNQALAQAMFVSHI